MFIRNLATADFDIFSQGVEGLAGGWKFFAADAAATLRSTSLASSNRRLSDILEIHFFVVDLVRYIFCKGTNMTTMAV